MSDVPPVGTSVPDVQHDDVTVCPPEEGSDDVTGLSTKEVPNDVTFRPPDDNPDDIYEVQRKIQSLLDSQTQARTKEPLSNLSLKRVR